MYSNDILVYISLPKFSMEQRALCEGDLTEKEVKDALNKWKTIKHHLRDDI